MPAINAFQATRAIEALENFSVSDNKNMGDNSESPPSQPIFINNNDKFWERVRKKPNDLYGQSFKFQSFVLCDWIPRIPGLSYFSEIEKNIDFSLLEEKLMLVEYVDELGMRWYPPEGKSLFVKKGVGSFCLPPDDQDGSRLVSICDTEASFGNANSGIPLLLPGEIFQNQGLKQGDILEIECIWQQMSTRWASRFALTEKIPRGMLIVKDPGKVKKQNWNSPVFFSPCTIMEYESEDAILFDYVFCTLDSASKDYRGKASAFFEKYRTHNGRNGKYLIASDINNPLFEAQFNSPNELRQKAGAESQLDLITERIRNTSFKNGTTINELVQIVPKLYFDSKSIFSLARRIGISPSKIREESAANMSIQLLDLCLESKKIEELIDRISTENSGAFAKRAG